MTCRARLSILNKAPWPAQLEVMLSLCSRIATNLTWYAKCSYHDQCNEQYAPDISCSLAWTCEQTVAQAM